MSLILYDATETQFLSNGLGILAETCDAEVYEQLNGQFELTLKYPITGRLFKELLCDRYITAPPDPERADQPFRIYRISKPLAGIVTVYARHWVYNLQKVVKVGTWAGFSAQSALDGLYDTVNPHPFVFSTDLTGSGFVIHAGAVSVWILLGSGEGCMLDAFGGEYKFDRNRVNLLRRRGTDRGVSIRYGKNLTDLQMDESIADVYTGVCPFWMGQVDGFYEMVELNEKVVRAAGNYTEDKLMPLDLSQSFTKKPTQAQLREAAVAYMEENNIGKPAISWTVSFFPLEQTQEYAGLEHLEQVLLGDTVTVYVEKLGVDVSARVVATTYNPLRKRYKNVTLGQVKANMATSMAKQTQKLQSIGSTGSLDGGRVTGALMSRDGSFWVDLNLGEVSSGSDSLRLRMKGNSLTGSRRTDGGEVEVFRLQIQDDGVDISGTGLRIQGKTVQWTSNGSGGYTLTGTE